MLIYIFILFTKVCLEHSQIFGWRICKNSLSKALSGMLDWVLNVFEIISFILSIINLSYLINYSLIALSIYSFTFLFINLCVCFKSVYTGRFSLLFPYVSMFYNFYLKSLYMKTFVRTFLIG